MKLQIQPPKQSLNKAYLKEKISRSDIELFKKNLAVLLDKTGISLMKFGSRSLYSAM